MKNKPSNGDIASPNGIHEARDVVQHIVLSECALLQQTKNSPVVFLCLRGVSVCQGLHVPLFQSVVQSRLGSFVRVPRLNKVNRDAHVEREDLGEGRGGEGEGGR